MGYTVCQPPDRQRHSRLENRRTKKRLTLLMARKSGRDSARGAIDEQSETGVSCQASVELINKESQTRDDDYAKMKEELTLVKEDNQNLWDTLLKLKQSVTVDVFSFTAEYLENNEGKLKFYTGM